LMSMITAYVGFFGIFLLWINLALHLPVSVVFADLCYDISTVTVDARLQERIDNLGANYSNSVLNGICYCPSFSNVNNTYAYALDLQQQLEMQQQEITNQSVINATDAALYYHLQAQINRLGDVEQDALYVRDCRWLLNVLEPIRNEMCGERLSGAVLIWAASFVLSVLLIPLVVAGIMGYKRFSSAVVDDGFF